MTEPLALDFDLLQRRFPLPHHPDDSDKEERGRLLVIAGSRELPGAAVLAGIAGLRAGAGKLQIVTAASVAVPIGVAVPEARVVPHRETEEGCISPEEVGPILKMAEGAQAVAIGCGLQHGPALDTMLDALLGSAIEVPLVLDAAVLGSLIDRSDAVRNWGGGAALLPHSGEMASLLGCEREEAAAEPLRSARTAAERYGAVALLKGEYSHVVSPDGQAFRYRGGGVGLATSGSGDTLAGIVGGLMARSADPLTATLWGIYLHGEAGRSLSIEVGRVGFLAREILDHIPRLMEGRA